MLSYLVIHTVRCILRDRILSIQIHSNHFHTNLCSSVMKNINILRIKSYISSTFAINNYYTKKFEIIKIINSNALSHRYILKLLFPQQDGIVCDLELYDSLGRQPSVLHDLRPFRALVDAEDINGQVDGIFLPFYIPSISILFVHEESCQVTRSPLIEDVRFIFRGLKFVSHLLITIALS
jgi:hypothetical protein